MKITMLVVGLSFFLSTFKLDIKKNHHLIFQIIPLLSYIVLLVAWYVNINDPSQSDVLLFISLITVLLLYLFFLIYQSLYAYVPFSGKNKYYSNARVFSTEIGHRIIFLFFDKERGLFIYNSKRTELLKKVVPQEVTYLKLLNILPIGLKLLSDNCKIIIAFPKFWKREIEGLYQKQLHENN